MPPTILAGCNSAFTAIIEIAEVGQLTPELAVSTAQTALVLMGNVHQRMAQERCKYLLMNLNYALKGIAKDKKSFKNAAPILFGDEFGKLATERVDQFKIPITRTEEIKSLFWIPPFKLLQGRP